MAILLALLTFVVVVAMCLLVWMFVSTDKNQEVVRRRMDSVRKAERRGNLSLGTSLVRDELLSSVPAIHRLMIRWTWTTKLNDYIVQGGMTTKPATIILMMAILLFGGYFVARTFFHNFFGSALIALLLAFAPLGYIMWARQRRLAKFEEHFPEALDLLGRAVRAGHAFTTGMEMIAKESDEPIGGEFRTTFEEQNFGLPLRDTLLNLTERVPLIDVRFFVTSLMIQKETGGNLAEILDGLSRVIRDRFRIHREVQTKTAQGKLTAAILIAIPPVMLLALSALNPAYMKTLTEDPAGPTIIGIAAALQILGSALLWKIIHIEV
jgi:tight adherence protein B